MFAIIILKEALKVGLNRCHEFVTVDKLYVQFSPLHLSNRGPDPSWGVDSSHFREEVQKW